MAGKTRSTKESSAPKKVAPATGKSTFDADAFITKFSTLIVVALTLGAIVLRVSNISFPASVVFDELHSGNHINKYLSHSFFVDVHPPLGKLLYVYTAKHLGYKGNFDFQNVDQSYDYTVPYAAFRIISAFLSAIIVPVGIATLRKLGASPLASIFAGILLTLDNGMIVQSKFFFMDASLIFFIALTVYQWTIIMTTPKDREFTFKWWVSIVLAGIFLGCAFSIKYCGAYLILTVLAYTAIDLWFIFGDLQRTSSDLVKSTIARLSAVTWIPVTTYILIFVAHINLLSHAGTGSTFLSQEYQATLIGNPIVQTQEAVGYGSYIRLVHEGTSGGFLHSHAHNYPTGSKQQQVSGYPFRDSNNLWIIQKPLRGNNGSLTAPPIKGFEKIGHGSQIRLVHNSTLRKLHSHDERAPLTDNEHHNEVTCYGDTESLGDLNDNWKIEFLDSVQDKGNILLAQSTRFRLRHAITGCYLFSHEVSLPEWGFNQQEVTCSKNGKKELETWRIDFNENPYQKQPTYVTYKPLNTFQKFVELHKVMWKLSARMKDVHPATTDATSWPLITKPMIYWSSRLNQSNIVFVGNPLIWVSAFLSVLLFFSMEGASALLWKRKVPLDGTVLEPYRLAGWATSLAWITNFVPYIFSHEQIFIANYLPALYFGVLCFAVQTARVTNHLNSNIQLLVFAVIALAAFRVFYMYSPLTYGIKTDYETCEKLKIRGGWEWECFKVSPPTPIGSAKNGFQTNMP